jgi:hypothetical protein
LVSPFWRSSGPETHAPEAPECDPMKYGSQAMISDGFFSGSTFVAAQRIACEMVMSRKSSQASLSSSLSFFLRSFSSGTASEMRWMASAVCM